MAIRTKEEYIESLRRQKPTAYMSGEKVRNIVDHPLFKGGINNIGLAYDVCNDPKYQDLATVDSPLIKEKVSRWNHIVENEQDAMARVKLLRQMGNYLASCTYRCITADTLCTAWVVTYEIDKKYGTSYHQNVVNMVKEIQKNDLVLGPALIDAKGDRSVRPSKQADPDVYLRIVERRSDGIVVRGAKVHSTATPYTNIICAAPVMLSMREEEKDFAVSFFAPVDAEGITYICRPPAMPSEPKEMENPYSSRFGGNIETCVVFNDVFIPWERVIMAGEYDFTGQMAAIFGAFHAMSKCGCRPASMDLAIGATALIADYNGIARAAHIRDYIIEMIMTTELTYSCGLAAAVDGVKHESGVYIPKGIAAFSGKAFSARELGREHYFMQEAAGGLTETMASEKDYKNPETREYLDKYYKGREDVPTEHRMRAFRLIEDLTASNYAGWYHAMAISGGGTAQAYRMAAQLSYDIEASRRRAKLAAGIEIEE